MEKLPFAALQKEVRKNRNNNRNADGTFDLSKRSDSKKVADDKCRLKCKSKQLVALWFATLDLDWKTGSKPASNPSLTDAIYADLSARGFEVDETTWVAYQVTLQTIILLRVNKNKSSFSMKFNIDVFSLFVLALRCREKRKVLRPFQHPKTGCGGPRHWR